MNGPAHYKAAEYLLEAADIAIGQYEEHGWDSKREIAETLTAQAQAHATLAVAAAVATYTPTQWDSDWKAAVT